MKHLQLFRRINALVFYGSCLLLLVSCWQRNDFPAALPVLPGVMQEPQQRGVNEPAFSITRDGVTYRVEPRYAYELQGLVVSYALHNPRYSLHRLWNDSLNVADLCIVWRDNARSPDLNRFKFWNGEFTCNFSTRDAAAWERFRTDQISNNHLLADNDYQRRQIGRVRIGDQIRVRGWLANYSNDQGFSRGTSITRDDRGNGACETIYVQDFSILQSMDNGWRPLLLLATLGLAVSSAIWIVAVARGVF
ncbi:MAG TPA: hypothetical protein VET88_00870 [Gammaproteobacteria bacterium]|nr:hypothetical protein [Gammaproteobacteria bacterium]